VGQEANIAEKLIAEHVTYMLCPTVKLDMYRQMCNIKESM